MQSIKLVMFTEDRSRDMVDSDSRWIGGMLTSSPRRMVLVDIPLSCVLKLV